jgi:hypothetical protein
MSFPIEKQENDVILKCGKCNDMIDLLLCKKCSNESSVSLIKSKKKFGKIEKKLKSGSRRNKISNTFDTIDTKKKSDDISALQQLKNSIPRIFDSPNFPVCVQIKHDGFWITNNSGIHISTTNEECDRNSVMLNNNCLLYVYKLALRHMLLSMHIIDPSDIDAANLVPHMVIRKSKTDPFSKYKTIQNKKFVITEEMLSGRTDFLIIELDAKQDLHTTMIYSRKISKKINLVDAIKTVISVLNAYPNLIQEYIDLSYFGQHVINYWYDIQNSYPFNIKLPPDYIPTQKNDDDFSSYNLSAAGSILSIKQK